MVEQWIENPCVSGSIPLLDNFLVYFMNLLSIFFIFLFQILKFSFFFLTFFLSFSIIFIVVWEIYYQINVFIKKIKKILICLKDWLCFFCYVIKSFKIVLAYMLELFLYDVLLYTIGLIVYAFYKIGSAVLTYETFLNLIALRYISEHLLDFNKVSFMIGLFFFQMVFLVVIYLQLKKVVNLLLILQIEEMLPHLVLLLLNANCYLLFFILKRTFFIQYNFLFVKVPLVYISIYILIFYLFFIYFIFIQLLFFFYKNQYPKIKKYFLVQDIFYFLCYLLVILVIFNYSFFFWLFSPLDNKLEESDLFDFLEKYVPDYKEILLGQESNKED